MEIIGHRGIWNDSNKKNSLDAFNECFKRGFGTETDIRDLDGELVISHDMPYKKNKITLDSLIYVFKKNLSPGRLALNIKSDGLAHLLLETLTKNKIDNYVVFDMSIPDTLNYKKLAMPYLIRVSEYEPINEDLLSSSGIWLDGFHSEWFIDKKIYPILDYKVPVYMVSSELHGRSPESQWKFLKKLKDENIILCTDHPKLAQQAILNE